MNFLLAFLALLTSLITSLYLAWALSFCSLVCALLRFSFFDLFRVTLEVVSFDIHSKLCYIASFNQAFPCFLLSIPSPDYPSFRLLNLMGFAYKSILKGLVFIPGHNGKVLGNKGILWWVDVVFHSTCHASGDRFSWRYSLPTRRWWSEMASAPLITPHIQQCSSKITWYAVVVYLAFNSIVGWHPGDFVFSFLQTSPHCCNVA